MKEKSFIWQIDLEAKSGKMKMIVASVLFLTHTAHRKKFRIPFKFGR